MNRPPTASSLVIYSAAEERYCASLLDAFRAAHPHTAVRFVFGISVALQAQYLAALDAGTPDADIVWSSAMDLQLGLVHGGHAQTYRSPAAADLPTGSVFRNQAYATTLEPLATLIDTRHVDAAHPTGSLDEIARTMRQNRGRLRGKLACFDIEHNGLGFLALMHESLHLPDFDAFMAMLAECKPRKCVSNPDMVNELAAGRAAIGFHLLDSYAARAAQTHPELAVAASATAPLAISRIAFIPRTAPHPETARCFLDFLLSREGQRLLAHGGFRPVRSDLGADAPAGMPKTRPIRIDDGLTELLEPQRRQAFLERWRRCVG